MALLSPVPLSEKPALRQLLAEYLAELKDLVEGRWDPNAYPYLEAQWSEAGRHPFFIQHADSNVGLAIVREPLSTGTGLNQLTEFYIRPSHRGSGLATHAAHAVFRRFPGPWELQVHSRNQRAARFWRRCIGQISVTPPKIRKLNFAGELKEHHQFHVD